MSTDIYREMLSVALERLNDAERRADALLERLDALREEIRRYTAAMVTRE